MKQATQKKILFVVNPISGGKKKEEVKSEIVSYCKRNHIEDSYYETTGVEDKEKVEEIVRENRFDAIVAVGGDGTVNLVGRVLVGTRIPLGIIPQGSGNGLAKDLNIPEEIINSLDLIKKFRPHPIDTLKINDHDVFHLSDFGFNARIVRRFSESLIRGKISYVWYGLIEFFTFKPFKYIVQTPLFKYEGSAFMMIVTNASQFGTNVNINPLGDIKDGYFEIIIIKPFPITEAFYVLKKLLDKTIHRTKYSKLIRCKEATIINNENESFHIDGEPVELGEIIYIKIFPKGLYVFKP